MSSLLKQSTHVGLAKTFYSDVLSQRNLYYYFLGRTIDWNGTTQSPPVIADTLVDESDSRNHIVYMTKITPSNLSFIVPRYDWAAGTVYDKYNPNVTAASPAFSGATNIKDSKFYVLTPEMNVYKCIDNNFNAPSTVMPTGVEYDVINTDDGYIWKYLYSVPPTLQYKFLTETQLPVLTALNTRYYDQRGIESVTIVDGGSGYEGDIVTYAVVNGDGQSAAVSLSISPVDGRIAKVRITNAGSGYTAGTIDIHTLDGKGTGIYGNPSAVLTPKFIDGQMVDVIIEDPGKDYSTNIQTNIIVEGNGDGALLVPVVENGTIVDVIIEKPGQNYTDVVLQVMSATGSGAKLEVVTSIGDIESIQSDVELLAMPGTIYTVDVAKPGSGYTLANCIVSGDGSGLQVEAVIEAGAISKFVVTSIGTGYSWCEIEIQGDGVDAAALPIISPYKGHGHNAIDELYADTICIYNSVKFSGTQPFFLNNEYRQFGIIRNPERFMDTRLYRDLTSTPCFIVTTDAVDALTSDMEFSLATDTSKKFIVIGVVPSTNSVMLQTKGNFNVIPGSYLVNSSDSSIGFTINSVTVPDVNKMSGEMIFVDNRMAIFQTSTQFVSLRTVIKF